MLDRVAPARCVRIAVPAYTGLCQDTHESLIRGAQALKDAGIDLQDLDVLGGHCYVDRARCILVRNFLKSDATDLIFIDADVGFEPDSLVRLCEATRPVVAGIYPKKQEPADWPVTPLHREIWSDGEGLIACHMVPTGFLRINRAVFEAIPVPTFADPDGEAPAHFKTEVRDGLYWGEDVEFCRLVREAGIPIHAFAEMDFRHVAGDGRVWRGNWGQWLRSQIKDAA